MSLRILAALILSACVCSATSAHAQPRADEVVILTPATPGELVLVERSGHLEVVDPKITPNGFLVGDREYVLDWEAADQRYAQSSAEKHLTVSNGTLTYNGKVVSLPGGIAMRSIWYAVLWHGWVIIAGRTSQTDAQAKLVPPFIANELIAFKQDGSGAFVKWLAPHAPTRPGILILQSK